MSDIAIKVENLSKRYRIGLEEEVHDTLAGQLASYVKSPLRNLRNLRRLTRFGENGQGPEEEPEDVIWALKDVSFEVERGEVVGIIGRNGAGKSTLLKILSRITHPTSGRVVLNGRVSSLLEVGTGFHPELTGRENVYLNGTILGMRKAEVDAKFDEIVAFSGVEKFIDTPVKRYSSGMRVRLAFAVAAHLEPEILLVDEVLAVGDIGFQEKCLGKMEDVTREGRTVLFVSHNMAAVSSLCPRSLLLVDGGLHSIGDTGRVIERYRSHVQSDEKVSVSLVERKDRTGNGALKFTQLYFVRGADPNQPGSMTLASGQPASIVVECESASGKPLENVSIAVLVTDKNGNRLFTCDTRLKGSGFDRLPPTARIMCNIPKLPLAPGKYRVTLWGAVGMGSTVGKEKADLVRNAGEFTVVEGDFFGTGRLPIPGKHGSVLVPHTWDMSDWEQASFEGAQEREETRSATSRHGRK